MSSLRAGEAFGPGASGAVAPAWSWCGTPKPRTGRLCPVQPRPPWIIRGRCYLGETTLIKVRVLNRGELQLIWKIDRSEVNHHSYSGCIWAGERH
jgi:hypothetical protein